MTVKSLQMAYFGARAPGIPVTGDMSPHFTSRATLYRQRRVDLSLRGLTAPRQGGKRLDEIREPVLGANVFRLTQTAPDCLRVLLQVGGSPFDCAGLGSTDRMRMACKRPGVRVPLAPLLDVPAGQMLR
jgi:hypothetical protein